MSKKKSFDTSDFSKKQKNIYFSGDRLFAAFITSFMFSYIITMFGNNNFYDLETYYNSIKFGMFFSLTILCFFALCIATYTTKLSHLIPRATLIMTTILSCLFAVSNNETNVYFLIGVAVVDLIIVLWLSKDDKLELSKIKFDYKSCLTIAVCLLVITTIVFGYYTSLRYKNFQNATFDFGIFCQMFENMATSGAPTTTLERSVELSHFGVHFSPVFYLLLPGYLIFRSPLYLLYSQVFIVALGVFAVYLICKQLKLSPKTTLAFEIIYAFYPCLINGCFYDFHENKFLTTIILFLFYFILADKKIAILLCSLLLLSVKEDAAIYLIVIALYVIISRKKYAYGSIMLSMAIVYFIIANKVVSSLGSEGVMMWRLSDYFVNGEESYASVLKSIIFDVGYLIKMMFTADKFPFIIWMFLPVMFSSFATQKISDLILLLPIIPINLMQSWQYQYNIDYQYTYGVAAMVIFLAIISIKNMKNRPKQVVLLMSVIMCLVMSCSTLAPKIKNNSIYETNTGSQAQTIDEALSAIPSDKSVTASHYLTPHLAFVKELYSVPDYYKDIEQTDFFIIDTRYSEQTQEMKAVMKNDYILVDTAYFVEIYKHR